MSTEENKALARRYLEEVWDKGNVDLERVSKPVSHSSGCGRRPVNFAYR